MTTPATPPTPAADPLDVLSPAERGGLTTIQGAKACAEARARVDVVSETAIAIIDGLARRLASAEQAKADAEARLAQVREARERSARIGVKAGGAEDGYRLAALGYFADQVDGILGLGDYAALGTADAAGGEGAGRESEPAANNPA